MTANGYNPMRWDCGTNGCFNIKCRPAIEVFCECLPRNVSFGDLDGFVELGGYFCILEWKGKKTNGEYPDLPTGQRLTLERFTSITGNVAFVVEGNPQTMVVDRYCLFWEGKQNNWITGGLENLSLRIKGWAEKADSREFEVAA